MSIFFKALNAVALVLVSLPAFVSAQDFFFSFDEFSREPIASVDEGADTGSVFIFADENIDFNHFDIEFSTSDPNVISFTGGTTFNSGGKFTNFDLLDTSLTNPGPGPTATEGRIFGLSILTPGITPDNSATDPDFRSGAGGVLLAQLDYDILGGGTADFDLRAGRLGVVNETASGTVRLDPTFSSGALTVQGDPFTPPVIPPPVDPPVVPPVAPPVVPPVDPPVVPPVAPSSTANFFFSFDENSREPSATVSRDTTDNGSVFIFADADANFQNLDLDFTNSDSSVVSITGGTTFNSDGKFTEFNLTDPTDPNAGPTATNGRLFGVSFLTDGVDPANIDTDPNFRTGADGVLLAQIDYDIVGGGVANFDFLLGDLGITRTGFGQVGAGFESAALTVLGDPVDPPVDPPITPPLDPPVQPPSPPSTNPDFFFSFDENSRVSSNEVSSQDATGSVFIFADENIDFNQLDLDFRHSDSSVVAITDVITFNDGGKFTVFDALDPTDSATGPSATDGRLFAVSLLTAGQVPGVADADFRSGANGFLLAQVNYEIIGSGSVNFDFILGDLGVFNDGAGALDPTFGSGQLEVDFPVAIPEPSSAMVLIFGAAAIYARRRRS